MEVQTLELGALFSEPQRPDAPGVVLIHDVWGHGDHQRDLAGRLAREGFSVLAIDLYHREAEVKIEDGGAWMRAMSDPLALADIQAGVDWLAARGATKVGVTGFCMGGMYALMAGGACSGVSAVVPFYGILSHRHGLLASPEGLDLEKKPREPLAYGAELRCPLLGFFGGRDDFIPLGDVEALRAELARSGQPNEVIVYPEAGHAFVNDTRPAAYRADDAADAWERMVGFLRERLDG